MSIHESLQQIELPRLAGQCHSSEPHVWRKHAYDIEEQLNFLYDDIQAGVFGEAAKSGAFATYVAGIKDQFPKS